jgi:hypothetical protein
MMMYKKTINRFLSFRSKLFLLLLTVPLSALDVDVTDAPYNAPGNGTDNDRPAIQQAIDDVTAAGGGTVTLPPGNTYITGDLELKSDVTLYVSEGATLLQSLNPDHYAHTPGFGRHYPGPGGIAWDDYYHHNYPLIYAGPGTTNIKITGGGSINGHEYLSDGESIFCMRVGFYRVSNFEVSDVTMERSHGYTVAFYSSDHGLFSNVTIESHDPGLNDDGISIQNSQHIRVTGSRFTNNDDLIYIWTSYQDPRGRTWWSSDNPQASRNIEIDNNILRDGGSANGYHGILFIGWGGHCPDLRNIEISHVYVHDNDIATPHPIAHIGPDPYFSTSTPPPAKDITYENNVLTPKYGFPAITLDGLPITNFSADFPDKTSPSTFLNSDFEQSSIYWSLRPNTDSNSAGARNDAVGQQGNWYGYIDNLNQGDAKIFQGLYLTTGDYIFSAQVQSSGAAVRMFARNNADSLIQGLDFSNTEWQNRTLSFSVPEDGNYRLGIERGNATEGWARMDEASIRPGQISIKESYLFTNQTPDTYDNDARYELGTRFRTNCEGSITRVRIYTHASEAGEHIVRIWDAEASEVVSGPHTWDIASGEEGWKEFELPSSLQLEPGRQYIVSVSNSSDNYYAVSTNSLNAPVNNGCLETYTGGGVFSTTLGAMPENSFQNSNYFRDVYFVPSETTGIPINSKTAAGMGSVDLLFYAGKVSIVYTGDYVLTVLDVKGDVKYSSRGLGPETIDLSHLRSGIYCLKLSYANRSLDKMIALTR